MTTGTLSRSSKVDVTREGSTAVIHLFNPPVNALTAGTGFVDRLREAVLSCERDDAVEAIVLTGAGRLFCGGADIADFVQPDSLDRVRLLIETVAASSKPVIAAIHGVALGGGLELALAAHYRVALGDSRLGFPEVTLGLLPGAGGTQRLPRLIGAGPALDLMVSGKPVSAERARAIGLVDRVAGHGVVGAAIALAAEMPPIRPADAMPAPADLSAAVAAARAKLPVGAFDQATAKIVACVAAVEHDFAEGLKVEAAMFDDLLRSDASRALRHVFLAKRAVADVPGPSGEATARAIRRVGVVGAGLMGTGITIALLNAGLAVTLVEPRAEALAKAKALIDATIRRDVDKGRIAAADADARLAGLATATALKAMADADIVIEAVYEEMGVKRQVFTALDAVTRPDAILASNTSTLDIDAIAGFVGDPSRVVGLHFFSPANIMRLLEVVRGRDTAPDVLATALDLGRRMRKVSVVAGVCDGFIGNRVFEEYLRQVWFLLEEGALPRQIDEALERWGMAMGPCRTLDLVGQDVDWAIRKRRAVEQPDRPYSGVIDRICELGRFGQKTGRGIYVYPDGRTAVDDVEIQRLIEGWSAEIGLARRAIDDAEIVERCLLAMINEGAKIVGEGIAYRPLDVDVTMLHGYGFPRTRGGPMFQGDLIGLSDLRDRLRAHAAGRHGWAWTPAPLIERLADEGGCFADLDGTGK